MAKDVIRITIRGRENLELTSELEESLLNGIHEGFYWHDADYGVCVNAQGISIELVSEEETA